MGICESSNNQTATTQQAVANTTAQASSNTGIIDTVKNAFGSNTNTQPQSNTGILNTVKNAIGSNTTTTNTANPSKMDTVTKVGKFIVENKDALGNLVS